MNSAQEVVGKTDYDLPWEKDQADFCRECDKKVMESGIPEFDIIEPLTRADGTLTWLKTNKISLRDREGTIVGILGTYEDITERKEAEDALRESEEPFRDLVENIEDLICTHDLQGNLLFVNEAPAKVLGYASTDLIGTNLRSHLAPEVRHHFDEYLATIQSDGHANGLMLVQAKTGEKRVWEYRNTLRTEGPAPPIVRGLARDISELKRSQKELRQSEHRFSLAIEGSSVGIVDWDVPSGKRRRNTILLKPKNI